MLIIELKIPFLLNNNHLNIWIINLNNYSAYPRLKRSIRIKFTTHNKTTTKNLNIILMVIRNTNKSKIATKNRNNRKTRGKWFKIINPNQIWDHIVLETVRLANNKENQRGNSIQLMDKIIMRIWIFFHPMKIQ